MNTTQPEPRYTITFPGKQPMTLLQGQIQSPTLLRAIAYIEQEPACTGVALDNGIEINIA